jgi:chromate transporter
MVSARPAPADAEGAGLPSYSTLGAVFLKLSLLGFGGPNAHLALMLDEVVERRRWIGREHFLQLVALTNLLPGPNSSEVAIHVGYSQRGWTGALVTGGVFLAPTFVMVTALSAAYFAYGTVPAVEPLFWGLKAVVLALIVRAGVTLARTAVDDVVTFALAGLGLAVAALAEGWIVPAMLLGGAITWATRPAGEGEDEGEVRRRADDAREREGVEAGEGDDEGVRAGDAAREDEAGPPGDGSRDDGGRDDPTDGPSPRRSLLPFALLPFAAQVSALGGVFGTAGTVFVVHLGIGAVLFGGGYVLVALLEPFAVGRYGWVTATQLLDGVALTQAVPGPISTLSAFVGYGAAGVPGAIAGTVGVYLPAFAAVLLVAPHLDRLRRRTAVRTALAGIGAVVAGTMVGVAVRLGPPALPDAWSAALAAVALFLLVRYRVQPLWLVAGGLAAGALRLWIA